MPARNLLSVAIAVAAALLLNSCFVTSQNPIWIKGESRFEPDLVGLWENPTGGDLTIERAGESPDYWVTTVDDDGHVNVALGVIAVIGGHEYMDFLSLNDEEKAKKAKMDPLQARYLVKGDDTGHMWFRLMILEGSVSFQEPNAKWFYNYLNGGSGALAHAEYLKPDPPEEGQPPQDVSGQPTSITADTYAIRSFIESHDSEMWGQITTIKKQADQLGGPDIELDK